MTRDQMQLHIARLERQLLAANEAAEQRRAAIVRIHEAIQEDSANHERHVRALREGLHLALDALQRARDNGASYCGEALTAVRDALRHE